jgi:hypothetical protein
MIVASLTALALMTRARAQEIKAMPTSNSIPSYQGVGPVAPALEKYAHVFRRH